MEISEVARNTKLMIDGAPYTVEEVNFVKPGKGRAIYRLKLRNLFDGMAREITYHSGDRVEEVSVTSHEMQFLYEEGGHYVFMDNETFEQHTIDKKRIGPKALFLKEGITVSILIMHGRIIDVNLPKFVELAVTASAFTTKTDTVTAQQKMITLETGATVGVPAFVKEGDIIKVDTRTGTYVERTGTKK
ncbi:MAG: elongation factor P [Chloroflexi bacterium]|nr:elongation factor P [Chloroflexota bacterium]